MKHFGAYKRLDIPKKATIKMSLFERRWFNPEDGSVTVTQTRVKAWSDKDIILIDGLEFERIQNEKH